MEYILGSVLRLFVLLLCIGQWCLAQSAHTATIPPRLANGESWEGKLRLVYREAELHYSVITVRFRVSKKGELDSLEVDGGPQVQKDSLRSQLLRLNGKWTPQLAGGKPIRSKWLGFRWYISGFNGLGEYPQKQAWNEMVAAYTREESLFNCTVSWDIPYTCKTPFIEGHDYFWFPPFHSQVLR